MMTNEQIANGLIGLGYMGMFAIAGDEENLQILSWDSGDEFPSMKDILEASSMQEKAIVEAEADAAAVKQSAIDKLAALGLTVEEIKAAFNLS